MKNNPGKHIIQMLCPWTGTAVGNIPHSAALAFLAMKKERSTKTGRIYREHVKEDLDAIEAFVSENSDNGPDKATK